jgi:integrase
MYALMFLGAMRFGEAAALTWRDYDAEAQPPGKLVIEKAYSSKIKKVKATKTDNPREMPIHATLARILATWKLHGFERYTGAQARPRTPYRPIAAEALAQRQPHASTLPRGPRTHRLAGLPPA